jgi:hypothetical protein
MSIGALTDLRTNMDGVIEMRRPKRAFLPRDREWDEQGPLRIAQLQQSTGLAAVASGDDAAIRARVPEDRATRMGDGWSWFVGAVLLTLESHRQMAEENGDGVLAALWDEDDELVEAIDVWLDEFDPPGVARGDHERPRI